MKKELTLEEKVMQKLVMDVAGLCEVTLTTGFSQSELNLLFARISDNLNLENSNRITASDRFGSNLRGSDNNKHFDFTNTKGAPHQFAYYFEVLSNPLKYPKKKVNDAVYSKAYGTFWTDNFEERSKEFQQKITSAITTSIVSASYKGLEIIDEVFWKKKILPITDTKYKDFLERGRTELASQLISSNLFPESIVNKSFNLNSRSTQTASLKQLIIDGTGNTCITFSSIKPLEGKTTFLWHLVRHLFQDLNCLWIYNLKAAEQCLDEIVVDKKDVLLILNSQIHLLDESNELLKLFIEKAEVIWRSKRFIVIIEDSQFNLSKYDTEIMKATQNFTELFSIEDFILTPTENLFIYESIKEFYKLEDHEPHIPKFNFTSSENIRQLSLAGRIRNLLDKEMIQPNEWRLWKEDETVKSLGLTDAYIIAAILECYSIKLPIDYHSETYFKTSSLSALGKLNLQSRNNEYDQIIQISTGPDYPHTYISLKNPSIACEYVHMNPNAKIVAEDFVLDLLKTITDIQAEDSHAYVFRKFFSLTRRKDKTIILSETLKTIDPDSYWDNLISSPKLSPRERQKCQTHKARLLFYKKLYPEALRALEGLTDDVSNLFRADVYAAQHDYENCLVSLNLMTPSELSDSGKCHCYLNDELVLEGIQYYLNGLKSTSGAKYHYKCLLYINTWHLYKKKFNEAIDVLDTIIDVVFKKSFSESIVQELYTHKANVYIQWGKFDLQTKINVRRSDFVDLAFDSINNAKNIGPLNIDGRTIEAKIYGFNGDYKTAFRLAKSISSDFPYHLDSNILLSKLYLQKHNDPITAEQDDLQNALKYIQINLNVFNRRFVHPIKQIQSFIVRAEVFSAEGLDERALNFLNWFKKYYKIDFGDNIPFTKPLLGTIKSLSAKIRNQDFPNLK